MNTSPKQGDWEDEEEARWLFVSGAPPLSGESAAAMVELLWAMADTVDGEYAAEIAAHRRRGRPERCPWSPPVQELQLRLELGDDDYY